MKINEIATLGRDPELKFLPSGGAILSLNLAFTEKVKKGDEYIDDTIWLRSVMFGKRAEYVADKVTKGDKIFVRGDLRSNNWEKDGVKHNDIQLMIDDVKLLNKKSADTKPQSQPKPKAEEDTYTDDIPF